MDVISHIIFATSMQEPTLGVVIGAVLPDVFALKRTTTPNVFYKFTHSLSFPFILFFINFDIFIGVCSHIALDAITHGEKFSPQFFYPFSSLRIKGIMEWEFFNKTYFIGLLIIVISWCVRISIGYPWLQFVR
jgi:membrane-bound metal-dependent hydrolase YbcI (DUF457 family)